MEVFRNLVSSGLCVTPYETHKLQTNVESADVMGPKWVDWRGAGGSPEALGQWICGRLWDERLQNA